MRTLGNKSLSAIIAVAINIIWWLEWIAAGIVTAVIIIASFTQRSISLSLPVTFSNVVFKQLVSANKDQPEGQLEVMNGNVSFQINNNIQNMLILLAGTAVIFFALLLLTYQLKLIFSRLARNHPFDEANIPRLRNIGFILIGFSFLQWLISVVIDQVLTSRFKWGDGVSLTYSFNISYLVAGIILIIVAGIFKTGVSLEEEQSLTI